MRLYVFRDEPGTGCYHFCTGVPQPIYSDDMRRVIYTDYGRSLGTIPRLTFEALFPKLTVEPGGYQSIKVTEFSSELTGYHIWIPKDEI